MRLRNVIVFLFCCCTWLITSAYAGSPKKVLFIVHTETINGKGVLDMYRAIKSRGHQVKIVAMPMLGGKDNKILYDLDVNFAKKFDPEDVFFPCGTEKPYKTCKPLENYKADIAFIQNPYNACKKSILDPHFTLEGLRKIAAKTAYVVYGPYIFHQTVCNDTSLKNLVDLIFVDSESTKRIFEDQYTFDSKNVIVSGFQGYKMMRDKIKVYKKPQDDAYEQTILWLPRWTVHFLNRDKHESGSTFLSYYNFFYNYALNNPTTKLIVRPHAGLFRVAVDNQFLTEKEVEDIKAKFKSLKNVVFSEHLTEPLDADVVQADVVISDGSSALGEVIVANKPIIYLSNGQDKEFESNDLGKEFKNFLFMAHDPLEIQKHLKDIKKSKYQPFASVSKDKKSNSQNEWDAFRKKLDPVEDPAEYIAAWLDTL